jgi:hypothetical protein
MAEHAAEELNHAGVRLSGIREQARWPADRDKKRIRCTGGAGKCSCAA